MITVALTKGRLFNAFLGFLEQREAPEYVATLQQNNRSLFIVIDEVRFIFAKGKDVPVYVERGVADLGIVGYDILQEQPANVLNVSKLPFGYCRMAVAGPPGVEKITRVATSYENITFNYFNQKREDVQLVHLHGSVELAPKLGLADVIVDIIQTGSTLKENGLVEYEKIMDIEARLIANKQSFYLKEAAIYEFIKRIGVF